MHVRERGEGRETEEREMREGEEGGEGEDEGGGEEKLYVHDIVHSGFEMFLIMK